MSTAAVNPDPTVTRTIITPDLSKPAVGQPTLVTFFDSDHMVRLSVGHVLSVGPKDETTGEPTLTIAFPNQPADERKLGSVRWSDAYTRVTGVQHYTHPDVRSGKLSIAWGGDGAIEVDNAPAIPQPAGNAENPIFARQELHVEPSTAAVQAEAINAQHGKAPEGAHVSPLTSEAGQTHDATVQGEGENAGAQPQGLPDPVNRNATVQNPTGQ